MKTLTQDCINWIKDYFKDNPDGKAIIGISGGKDSTVAAALCVEALGADRVIGVLMPNGDQGDIMDSFTVCSFLGIDHTIVNIGNAYKDLSERVKISLMQDNIPGMLTTNLPARLRMSTLYAVAAFYPNSRVVNTCNRSEDYVGYSTKYGDAAGDFSPLGNLTVREVIEIGDDFGLPEHLVHKAPSDGMCGKTDEDNLGFTYQELDDLILGTGEVSEETKAKIEQKHKASRHKYVPMPTFRPIHTFTEEDYSKVQRGKRAQCDFMDDYAGGIIDPNVVMSIAGCGDVNVHVDIASDPGDISAALEKNLNTADVIKSIEKEMWRSVMRNEIRGIK